MKLWANLVIYEIEWFTIDTKINWIFTIFCNLVIKIREKNLYFLPVCNAKLWQLDAHLISSTIWFEHFLCLSIFYILGFCGSKRSREIYSVEGNELIYVTELYHAVCLVSFTDCGSWFWSEKYLTVLFTHICFNFSYYTVVCYFS